MIFKLILTSFINLAFSYNINRFYTESPWIKDEYGRVRIFHGINRIEKHNNYYYDEMLEMVESDKLKDLGFNVVRLQWMWNAFEPVNNQFNLSYFNKIEHIVNNLGKNGIYTILDSHQDELGDKYCSQYGLPLWAMNKIIINNSNYKFPWPFSGNCSTRQWSENLLSYELSYGFQNLYDNINGIQDDFIHFWQKSLEVWKNNPYILGCELINEPFIGDFYKDPLLFLPGEAGKSNLMPFYNKVSKEIRKYDYNRILFYEPITWGMIYDNKIFGNGLNQVPGGIEYSNTSVYSYHYYCSAFVLNSEKHLILRKDVCDKYLAPKIFKNTLEHINSVGGSSFLTEFGACSNDDLLDECNYIVNTANQNFQSWTDYTYAQVENLSFSKNWTSVYSKPYAQAISGVPINTSINDDKFELYFNINTSISEPTIVYYKKFKNINVSNNLKYNVINNYIYLFNSVNNSVNNSINNNNGYLILTS